MTYLLDTHYIIWAIIDTKKLSKKLKEFLVNPDNVIVVSPISFWEISIKSASGRLELQGLQVENIPNLCARIGFNIIPLSPEECCTYHQLDAIYHKDPFDRMLIWQAIRNGYTLISVDADIKKYTTAGLKIYAEK